MDSLSKINEFVSRLHDAAGKNLQSVILYGSAAGGEFHRDFSNINLLCIVREPSFAHLSQMSDAVHSWTRQGHPAPLVFTADELTHSADVFSIEMLDMKRRYNVVFGDDVLRDLVVPMHLHRAQLEYELREKLVLLRQRVLTDARDDKKLWEMMLASLSGFTTLFRHSLLALGDPSPHSSRDAIRALRAHIPFDPSGFEHLFDIREHRVERKRLNPRQVLSDYLLAIQQVTTAVDTMLDSPRPPQAVNA